eukprot:483090-Hanusia_phi.AAC.2
MVTTEEGSAPSDLIARHGIYGIFEAMRSCVPGATRSMGDRLTNRKAISEAEMLRELEQTGKYERFRSRKAVRRSMDPSGAGMCMFKGRRWRNPEVESDLRYLEMRHRQMCTRYDVYNENSSFNKIIEILKSIRIGWDAYLSGSGDFLAMPAEDSIVASIPGSECEATLGKRKASVSETSSTDEDCSLQNCFDDDVLKEFEMNTTSFDEYFNVLIQCS